jgi:serine/threonine-protein kinase
MPLASGARAAGFKIVRLLGCGPTGEVYLAEHPRLPRRHALRILSADISADSEYRARFIRDSDLAAALWHPHIVGLCDRGEWEGRLWLSVDYIDGSTAAQLVSDSYPEGMPPHLVVEIVTGIADALDYAHDHGLLHRHVKPGNVLITQLQPDEQRILLADLGIAQIDDVNGLISTNLTASTVSYTAPEQLMDSSIDSRVDQYALACTAFHLLTGSPPFAHGNPAVVISKHLNQTPPRPSDVRPELASFDEPIARGLAKVPSDRFPRCRDFAEALKANYCKPSVLSDTEVAGAPTRPKPTATVVPREPETDTAAASPPAAADPPDAQTGATVPLSAQADSAGDHGPAQVEVAPHPDVADAVTSPEPATSSATTDDGAVTRGDRVLPRAVSLVLAVVVVLIGFFVVVALRSRAGFHHTPTNVETPSSATRVPPPPVMPATATSVPSAPAPLPAITTLPTLDTPTPTITTSTPPAITPTPLVTTTPTVPIPSLPPTTSVPGIDSRPAVGMPCGPQETGATTISNSGAPVSCVGTPGGFAWEPAGG